jgi:hypothetical protein
MSNLPSRGASLLHSRRERLLAFLRQVLDARREHLDNPHRLKIYPPIGHTVDDGHDFLHLGLNIWEPDVSAFLDEKVYLPV